MILSSPWRTLVDADPASSYVALLGVVRLTGVRILPAFIRFGVKIDRQLKRTSGAIGYRTGADVARLGFYHLSAWKDSEAIEDFVAIAPHVEAIEQLAARLGTTTFRYWCVSGSELPMDFGRELYRLH